MPEPQETVPKHPVPGNVPRQGLLPVVLLASLITFGSICLALAAFLSLKSWPVGLLVLVGAGSLGLAITLAYRSVTGRLDAQATVFNRNGPPAWSLNLPARLTGAGETAETDLELLPTDLAGTLVSCIHAMEQRDKALADLLVQRLVEGGVNQANLETALDQLRISREGQSRQIEHMGTALDRLNVEIRRQLAIIRTESEPG